MTPRLSQLSDHGAIAPWWARWCILAAGLLRRCGMDGRLEEMRRALLARRHALLGQVAQTEADLRWLDTNIEPEAEEEGQEENLARLLARLDDREQAELGAIDRALVRLASGDYGRCVVCGTLIPWPRLEALPAAERCVSCAQAQERH